MEATMFDEFCAFISRTPAGSTFTNYDLDLALPLSYDFPIKNESSGPSLPPITAPYLCHTRVPGSSHYQSPMPLTNLPQFYAKQGQVGTPPLNVPTKRLSHSWYPDSQMIGRLGSSLSNSSFTSTKPSATFDRGQALSNTDIPAGSGPQPFFQHHEKYFPTSIITKTKKPKSSAAPEAGPSTSTGKAPTIQRSKMARFTPVTQPPARFHGQQDQGGARSFNLPTESFLHLSRPTMVGSSSSSSSVPNTESSAPFDRRQASVVADLPANRDQQALVSPGHNLPLINRCSTPGSDVAPTAESSTLKTSKRKASKRRAPKMDRLKEQSLTGIMTIEKENMECIVGECSVICASVKQYRKHLKVVHAIRNSHTSGSKVDCPVSGCSGKLREGSLMRHILSHMDAVRVVCATCFTSYTRIETLRAHMTARQHGGKSQTS